MIFADLYHGNIKTMDDFRKALEFYEISQDAGRSFLEDLVSQSLLHLEDDKFVINTKKDWTRLGQRPEQGLHFVPELFQIVSKRGLTNRVSNTQEDKFLNFAAYFDFPGDESTLIKLRSLYTNFYKELKKVHDEAQGSASQSKDIYTLCLGSSRLEREDFQ
ncbi:MAG: hypothetical protein AAF203_02685 [Pseudomonadota bacterium]